MKKKVLIVDDLKSWLLFHGEIIHSLYGDSVEIILSSSAREALKVLNENIENPFDIILTDLQMESDFEPKCAGEWLIEEIKNIKTYAKTPIVIISAMHNIEWVAKKHEVDFIPKNRLVDNKLLMKLMFEKLLPSINQV